jgi:hypothetical protein
VTQYGNYLVFLHLRPNIHLQLLDAPGAQRHDIDLVSSLYSGHIEATGGDVPEDGWCNTN